MTVEERVLVKSFFYNLVSKGYYVYKSIELNNFMVQKLICENCKDVWNTSRQECYLCGTENYHIYICSNCDHKISITRSNISTCENCGSTNNFIKSCLNKECITNKNETIKEKVIEGGGIYGGSSGFSIRQMSCKNCGSRKNLYVSAICNIVFKKEELDQPFSVYLEREDEKAPIKKYWIKNLEKYISFESMDEFIEYQFINQN